MSISEEQLRVGRQRVSQVFRYLEALNQHRNPAKRHLDNQLWHIWLRDLPDHPSIRIATFADPDESSACDVVTGRNSAPNVRDEFVVRVRRPKLTPCPLPPDALLRWLERGWQEPTNEAFVRKSVNDVDDEGKTILVGFGEDHVRVQAYQRWLSDREIWALNEKPAREAMQVFEKLYEIRGQIEREGEKLELVLGEGILSWKRPEGGVFHPILLQRLQLEFDPTIPEFSIVEAEKPVELYSALFQPMADVDGHVLARARRELEDGKFHPLGKEDTSGFLRSLAAQLSPHGEFRPHEAARSQDEYPLIGRSPVIFLRPRNLGFAIAIQSALENLSQNGEIPSSLLRIVGVEDEPLSQSDSGGPASWIDDYQPTDVLLSKPANPEQIRIVKRLEQHGSVLVQGPPGTGKSHSIANLIGHLLAQGKSILVTSQTTKALKVVRNQVVPQLRPLCVSLLDSDIESRKQLESSVDAIVSKLSFGDARQLDIRAAKFQQRRDELVCRHRHLTNEILNARANEYREIVVGGLPFAPATAARRVNAGFGVHDYLPGPVELGAPLPLSETEIAELYRTNQLVSAEDESELCGRLPNLRDLPSIPGFQALVTERTELSKHDLSFGKEFWEHPPEPEDENRLELLSEQLMIVSQHIRQSEQWKLAAMLAGYNGEQQRKAWESLLTLIDQTSESASEANDQLFQYQPQLPGDIPLQTSRSISQEILKHFEHSGRPSFLVLLTRSMWKGFIEKSRVAGQKPTLVEHFRALSKLAELRPLQQRLVARWSAQLVPLGAPDADGLGAEPETICRQFAASLKRSLDWHDTQWKPLQLAFFEYGLRFARLLDEQPPNTSAQGELLRLADLLAGPVQAVLAARRNLIAWNRIARDHAQIEWYLAAADGDEQSALVIDKLRNAVQRYDPTAYSSATARLVELFERRKHLERRRELLIKLEAAAPAWASAIRNRLGIHGRGEAPANVRDAWLWRQLNDEFENRGCISPSDLENEAAQLTRAIQDVTAELIDSKSWAAQLRRTERNLRQKQALVGWLDTVRKMGKGTGIRVPKLKTEANRLMTECRGAVPVWIMPLSRVAENFDPRTVRFDVVIIDEASQSDVMGLIALYFAERAIVVGDHEQVSPSAVGQELGVVQHLIDEHLDAIPNAQLYDGQMSIYDLARQSFGGTIRLIEHFRCVPEIIQFSNQLCYEGEIRPLRDPSQVFLKPHVIAHRVTGASCQSNYNEEEALEIVALILAACEQPEYSGKTFGIVSLVGDEQAYRIDALLRKHLPEEELKSHHEILCGNAAQFQGDERDVMFLSMVDTSDGSVLKLRQEPMFRQRFNVAASRARDQMWVVYSLDPRSHLKPGDLRRKLIEHAEDPYSVLKALEDVKARTESPFEREVASRLQLAGYRVIPQWRVGHYRIDLVVEGSGGRVAIECDGDRFHPIEKLPDDMARQAVLERLGWTFIRLRGSQFFRDPDGAMKSVLTEIQGMGIEPSETESAPEELAGPSHELIERIRRRAKEIRREWLGAAAAVSDKNEHQIDRESRNNGSSFASSNKNALTSVQSWQGAEERPLP